MIIKIEIAYETDKVTDKDKYLFDDLQLFLSKYTKKYSMRSRTE